MSAFTAVDSALMARALRLAEQGRYTTHPNPMVGCVLVRDGEIIGEGWHRRAGEAHAEVNALMAAGDARGATAYVSLEPCAHRGRTPPCTQALIDAGVEEVVFALADPNPAVDGNGANQLVSAGIRVRSGLMRDSAAALNRGFLSRATRQRPFIRLKIAASLDGATAMHGGESQWITGRDARADVQRLRAESSAVLTGVGTVLADDPSLTVRQPGIDTGGRQPLRVVADSRLRTPPDARLLTLPGEVLLYCAEDARKRALLDAGAEVVCLPGEAGRVDLPAVMADLAGRGVNDLLVEAGSLLAGSLLVSRCVDELVIYQAPHMMGSETRRMLKTPAWMQLADRQALEFVDARRVGQDLRIVARPIDED